MLTVLLGFLATTHMALAQRVVSGQIFTPGLAIVDAPAVGSTHNVGSNIPIAIEVSGNGHLAPGATNVASNADLPTRFDSLEIYLVSSETSLNVTVTDTASFLTQEEGSSVKHLDFWLPVCLPGGNYNLTLYETSHINGTEFFTITPIPIVVFSPARVIPCTNWTNHLDEQPQADARPTPAPYTVDGSSIVYTVSGAPTKPTVAPLLMITSAIASLVWMLVEYCN